MNILVLTVLPIVIAFVINRLIGNFIGAFFQGAGSYLISYYILKQIIETEINSIDFIVSGGIIVLALSAYSRTQDDQEGPSPIRAQIQGVGFYAFITAIGIAIFG